MFQSNVNSNQLPAVVDVFQEAGKKVNTVLRQGFSPLQVSDMMSPIFWVIIVLMDYISRSDAKYVPDFKHNISLIYF